MNTNRKMTRTLVLKLGGIQTYLLLFYSSARLNFQSCEKIVQKRKGGIITVKGSAKCSTNRRVF